MDLIKTHSAFEATIHVMQDTADKIMAELRERNGPIVSTQNGQLSQKSLVNLLEKEHERQDKSWRDAYV